MALRRPPLDQPGRQSESPASMACNPRYFTRPGPTTERPLPSQRPLAEAGWVASAGGLVTAELPQTAVWQASFGSTAAGFSIPVPAQATYQLPNQQL